MEIVFKTEATTATTNKAFVRTTRLTVAIRTPRPRAMETSWSACRIQEELPRVVMLTSSILSCLRWGQPDLCQLQRWSLVCFANHGSNFAMHDRRDSEPLSYVVFFVCCVVSQSYTRASSCPHSSAFKLCRSRPFEVVVFFLTSRIFSCPKAAANGDCSMTFYMTNCPKSCNPACASGNPSSSCADLDPTK